MRRKREKQAQKAAEEQHHKEQLAASAKAAPTTAAQILAQDSFRSATGSPAVPRPGLRPPQPPPRANSAGPGPVGASSKPDPARPAGPVNSSYPGGSKGLQRGATVGTPLLESGEFVTGRGIKRGIDSAGLLAVAARSPTKIRGNDVASVGTAGIASEKLKAFKRQEN